VVAGQQTDPLKSRSTVPS